MITDLATTSTDPAARSFSGLSTAFVYGMLVFVGVPYAIFCALVTVLHGLLLWLGARRTARPASS